MDKSKELIVVKHNGVIEAGYKLTLYETRILLFCIAQIDSMEALSTDTTFVVYADELFDLLELDRKSAYRHLKKAAESLIRRIVTINLAEEGSYMETHWVSSITYKEGSVGLRFGKDIIPFISELSRNFTKYKLENVLQFRSSYSIRLYELLVKWEGDSKYVELAWIKDRFQLEEKYKDITNLKRRVLDVAVKEINEHSDMKVDYEQVKRGRRVTGFIFKYEPKSRRKVDRIPKAEIESQARPGETYQQVKIRLRQTR